LFGFLWFVSGLSIDKFGDLLRNDGEEKTKQKKTVRGKIEIGS